jgi:DNA-binding PadR family transcriptional regulator
MANPALLGYAILGLLAAKPYSGYDLRKIFTATPMGHFSDSPGSIYPALSRLEDEGFVRGAVVPGKNPRARRVFRVTAKGLTVFKRWLSGSDDAEAERPAAFILRFSFADGFLSPAEMAAMVSVFRSRMAATAIALRRTHDEMLAALRPAARLALVHGIRVHEAQRDWADEALTTLGRARKAV